MKRHLPTIALFAAAIALYIVGQEPGFALLFVAGIGCEIFGWRRFVARKKA
jgi:hypothetical protein